MNVKGYITIKSLNKSKNLLDLELGQGCIFEQDNILSAFYHNGEPMQYLAYIEFSSNKERGNHYHKYKEENICIIKGKVKAKYWLPETPQEIYEVELKAGEIVNIKPGCAHSYLAQDFAVAVEFSPNKYIQGDTFYI